MKVENAGEDGLMKAVAAGDEEAFTLLFRRYQRAIFHFACRMTGSVEAAEDLTQECFLRVLRSAKRFDPERGSLRVYLYATARNLTIREAQKLSSEQAKRRLSAPMNAQGRDADDGAGVEMLDLALGPEGLLLGLEASEVVKRAVWRLPTAQREALVLVEYEELSLEETAQVLEIDVGAAKSRVHRARENLKRLLAPYFGCEALRPRKDER
ncbi:MAG TPA: sigma-70 family RNA polymerase sigma factor [Bryobacteraceae bacterium]|nr:sigma-70 family RNA polymerase sigma factor [Bryobacteraceae bacterium]